jgi:AraC family transcriptional regulator of adaptative response / DNA-3-methyladenine glycosylase II
MAIREIEARPRGPYDLAASARMPDRVTRRLQGGVLECAVGRDGRARVRQRPDGALAIRLEADDPEAAWARLRFELALDDDPTELIRAHRADPLLGPLLRRRPGLRVLRAGSAAHAALRAFAGQLISFGEAQRIERRVLLLCAAAAGDGLRASPSAEAIAGLGAARVAACGLATRRADALVGLLRRVDLERLGALEPAAVEARLAREPQVGPWSIAVIAAQGWGWPDHGPVGDLGLMKLASAVNRRPATVEDTAELLAPYAPQRALAGLHLLGHPQARQRRPMRAAA